MHPICQFEAMFLFTCYFLFFAFYGEKNQIADKNIHKFVYLCAFFMEKENFHLIILL